jgi:ABC-2 type transport system permease protein
VLAISGVFFPVEALPNGLRQIANVLPTTHAFAAARDVLDGNGVPWGRLGVSLLGTLAALVLATGFGSTMLKLFRSRGFVTRYS